MEVAIIVATITAMASLGGALFGWLRGKQADKSADCRELVDQLYDRVAALESATDALREQGSITRDLLGLSIVHIERLTGIMVDLGVGELIPAAHPLLQQELQRRKDATKTRTIP